METSYELRNRVTSLSERIKSVKKNTLGYTDKISDIFFEKTKYNLSFLLAEIIYNLDYPDLSKETLIAVIDNYNAVNYTKITFNDLEKKCWIRIFNKEIYLPSMIRHFLWTLDSDHEEINKINISEKDIALCLLDYYKNIYNKKYPTITKDRLTKKIEDMNIDNRVVDFLLE
jgi:hypothetical protein